VDADHNPPKPTDPKRANPAPENSSGDPLPNSAADEFFVKMNRDFRRPKPSEEAVAAALHAIQTLAGEAAESEVEGQFTDDSPGEEPATRIAGATCSKCGAGNSAANRFCASCGTALARRAKPATTQAPALSEKGFREPTSRAQTSLEQPRADSAHEQHIHHHHHHYFPESVTKPALATEANATLSGGLTEPPLTPAAAAETAIQKLVRDWTLRCNSKRLDDLLALYSPDAIVLRSNVAPAHGRAAIRDLLQAALQAGLGDVELQPADAGILGDIACLTGTSRMLVPAAPGKRREEFGKFLIVARRENGDWKILADSWCIDSLPKPSAPPPAPVATLRSPRSK
jgi:ketosteroid isomerase-like protein